MSLPFYKSERDLRKYRSRNNETYEPVGTDVQVLLIKDLTIKCKPGENAEELLDKITSLIKQFSEDGNWHFKFSIES